MRGRATVLVTSLLLLAACDGGSGPDPIPTPTPSPAAPAEPEPVTGLQVGIVLPPVTSTITTLEARALAGAAEELPQDPDLDVRDVRIIQAPTAVFRRDELAFLAERGAGLVCTVGNEGAQDLLAVADAYPRTRFCLLAGDLVDPPRNVFAVSWERGRAASVVGAAAALTAPAVPNAPPARVRIVAAGLEDLGELTDAILNGARRLRGAIDMSVVTVAPDASVDEVREVVVGAASEGGPGAVLVAAGGPEVAEGVLAAAADVRGLVLGWSVPPTVVRDGQEGGEDGGDTVVASVVRRFDVALRLAVRHVAGELPAPEPLSLADGFALVPGAHPRWSAIRPRLERYVLDLSGQEPVILEPPRPSPSPATP